MTAPATAPGACHRPCSDSEPRSRKRIRGALPGSAAQWPGLRRARRGGHRRRRRQAVAHGLPSGRIRLPVRLGATVSSRPAAPIRSKPIEPTPRTDPPPTTVPRRRRRRAVGWFVGLILIAAVAAGAWLLRPATLTTLLVAQARQHLAVELHLSDSAHYALLPDLSLSVPAIEARNPGETAPLFSAASAEVALPWSSLWRRPPRIERLVLERPQIDLDALERWLARQPADAGGSAVPAFRLQIRDGSLRRHGSVLASGIEVDLRHAGELDAWLAQWREGGPVRTLPPLSGRAGVRAIEIDGTRIEGLRLEVEPDTRPAGTKKPGP